MDFRISATAIRVFRGFRGASQTDDKAFLQTVGQTFMPGTPYMLRSGGLASYTSGVLLNRPDDSVPEEFALIGYASADTWNQTMNHTLQGRMYNQTHGGVYDMHRSGAAFPKPLATLAADAPDPFFTWGEYADWQAGGICVYIGMAPDKTAPAAFRAATRQAIGALAKGSDDCLVCSPGDTVFIVWAHAPETGAAAPDWTPLQKMSTPLLTAGARRVLWKDPEPPLQTFTDSSVMNWIFVRDERFFLQ